MSTETITISRDMMAALATTAMAGNALSKSIITKIAEGQALDPHHRDIMKFLLSEIEREADDRLQRETLPSLA